MYSWNERRTLFIERIEQFRNLRCGGLVAALDGPSGVGKTTIATQITGRIRSVHVVCDDFFVGDHNQFWAAKSTQEKIDNVIDWRRLKRGSD